MPLHRLLLFWLYARRLIIFFFSGGGAAVLRSAVFAVDRSLTLFETVPRHQSAALDVGVAVIVMKQYVRQPLWRHQFFEWVQMKLGLHLGKLVLTWIGLTLGGSVALVSPDTIAIVIWCYASYQRSCFQTSEPTATPIACCISCGRRGHYVCLGNEKGKGGPHKIKKLWSYCCHCGSNRHVFNTCRVRKDLKLTTAKAAE